MYCRRRGYDSFCSINRRCVFIIVGSMVGCGQTVTAAAASMACWKLALPIGCEPLGKYCGRHGQSRNTVQQQQQARQQGLECA
jgi:hypothetical protein